MYNKFANKKYERKWSCTTNLLYNEKTIIGRLYHYFYIYFEACSIPTAGTLVLLLLSILTLESADSIRFLYRHFLSKLTDKSLNAFYYACSYAKVDYSRFMNATASMALKLIPKSLETQPVFLCIDDTIVPKYGKKFEDVSKLFDHSAHNGSGCLSGYDQFHLYAVIQRGADQYGRHHPGAPGHVHAVRRRDRKDQQKFLVRREKIEEMASWKILKRT